MRDQILCCPNWDETGFGHYLPFKVPPEDIEAAVTALKDANLLQSDGSRLRFTSYPVNPSKIESVDEKKRYEPLVDIANVLQKLIVLDRHSTSCEFLQQPNSFNEAGTYDANFKVDALLRLKQSTMPSFSAQSAAIPVADLAVPSEYMTTRRDVRENREQLLGTVTFCMNDDPRRTHIYGITIEDDTMAVWYFSRSHSAKSPDFKFTEDYRRYIEVMLSLMFATEQELGYDPTVQRRLDPVTSTVCFVYVVDEHYYKTQKAIFDLQSLRITGRATRVWEVVEVASFDKLEQVEGSHTMVLKDVWIDTVSMTEGKIQRDIFTDLKKIADALRADVEPKGFEGMDPESKEALRECLLEQNWQRYFLTVIREWQGVTSKEVAESAVPNSTLFSVPHVTAKHSSLPHADLSRMSLSQPSDLVPREEKSLKRHYCGKRQSRIIFEQVCVALHDVPQLGDALTALLSCVFALQLMFLAGWVHRDLSTGNLYLLKDDNGETRGILGDLEYAKRFRPSDGNCSSDPKTGTAFFMAIEVHKQLHLYKPRKPLKEEMTAFLRKNIDPLKERKSTWGNNRETQTSAFLRENINQSKRHPVVHNFQHDMESIFWILLWIILARFPCKLNQAPESAAVLSGIFQDTSTCSPRRERVFSENGHLRDLLGTYLTCELEPLQNTVDGFRRLLMAAYLDREYRFDDMPSYARLYEYLRLTLSRCQESIRDKSLPDLVGCRSSHHNSGRPNVARLPHQVKKRKCSTSGTAGDDDEYRMVASKKARGQESTNTPVS